MAVFQLIVTILFVAGDVTSLSFNPTNNLCKTYTGYLWPAFSDDCYHDPDVWATTPELLMNHVEVYETHLVTSEDGYINTVFRIPHPNPRGVIALMHPVTVDATIYLGQSNESFAYHLSHLGYDVWLPNNRGTVYSDRHVNLTSNDFEYWDFSFHEIGMYDYPAFFAYISAQTNNSQLIFIGHSMANTAATVYAALKPDEASRYIANFIFMSPIAYFTNLTTPLKYLIPFYPLVKAILDFFQIGALLQKPSIYTLPIELFTYFPVKKIAVYIISFVFGWTPDNWDPATISLATTQMTRGASWKSIYHFCQVYRNKGIFQYYDYGTEKNQRLYGSANPPEYPVENIKLPIYMITSSDDKAGTIADSNILYEKLSTEAKIYGKHDIAGLNHPDFHYGKNRIDLVFNHIAHFLDDPTKYLVNKTRA